MKFRLFSHTEFTVKKHNNEFILNWLASRNINYEASISGDNLKFITLSKHKSEICDCLEKRKIDILSIRSIGIFSKLKRFKRVGLILSALLIPFSVFVSSKFVWKINVYGNESLSKDEIIMTLSDCGFGYGKFIPNIRYDKLHNEILIKNRDISWISINIDGNVANVYVQESKKTDTQNEYYANIVAKADAQILEIRVKNGEGVVRVNDIVKEGELLISGIIDSQSQGVRYEKAAGEVLARTNHEIFVEFPYRGKDKLYTGRIYTERKIKIFSKVINFSIKSNKNWEFYDKIEENKQIKLFGKYFLPIFVENTKYFEYQMVDKEYSRQEAIDLSFKELKTKIDDLSSNAELLSKSIETSFDENGFYILCKLECIENIAKEVRIYKN